MAIRTLLVMRHGDAAMVRGISDKERPLTELGHEQVVSVANQLEADSELPHTVITSRAIRAQESKVDLFRNWKHSPHVDEDRDDFYLAGLEQLEDRLMQIDSEVESLMVLGHNPGWSEVVGVLSGQYCALGTAFCAVLKGEFPNWQDAIESHGVWKLKTIYIPEINI